MLNYLTMKDCEQLGIHPEHRTKGQLTIQFRRGREGILVMRVLPHLSTEVIMKRFRVVLPETLVRQIPIDEDFVYHLGPTEWFVRTAKGEDVRFARLFHDHARKALLPFITRLDEHLARLDGAISEFEELANDKAQSIAKQATQDALFLKYEPYVTVRCTCEQCPQPELPNRRFVEQAGYIPVYIGLHELTHPHPMFTFVQSVVEVVYTRILRAKITTAKRRLAGELVRTIVVQNGPVLEG